MPSRYSGIAFMCVVVPEIKSAAMVIAKDFLSSTSILAVSKVIVNHISIMLLPFLDSKVKITSKKIESPFIWIYGTRERLQKALNDFSAGEDPPNEETVRRFINADFWEALLGFGGDEINLLNVTRNFENPDVLSLQKKITNAEQLNLIRKVFEIKKTESGFQEFSWILNKKIYNKGRICQDFGIINETLVNWLRFVERHKLLAEDFQLAAIYDHTDSSMDLDKIYKLTLFESCTLYRLLNSENPISQNTFTKDDLRRIIFPGDENEYKGRYLKYKLFGEVIGFEIFPFFIFKMLLEANGYDFTPDDFQEDWKNRNN